LRIRGNTTQILRRRRTKKMIWELKNSQMKMAEKQFTTCCMRMIASNFLKKHSAMNIGF